MTGSAAFQDWVDRAKAERTETVLHERGILKTLKGRNGIFAGPCPQCGGRDRFAVNLGKGNGGVFHCRGCQASGGDAIALVCFLNNCEFLDAVEVLAGPAPDGKKRETDEERREREQRAIQCRERLQREQIKREQREAEELRKQHRTAAWLWSQRKPIAGTIAETYLRGKRGTTCPLPPTLAFLPARKAEHHPAISAFGLVKEIEPGLLGEPRHVEAVHLTLLKPDGSDKADIEPNKIVVGSPVEEWLLDDGTTTDVSFPIIVAPPNDLLGLAITEGVEDGLTEYQTSGLGVWAASSAVLMPKLAWRIPDYIECVTIFAHDDKAGQEGVHQLAELLDQRNQRDDDIDIEIRVEGL